MDVCAAGATSRFEKRGNPSFLLPEILRELYLGRRTGLLHVRHGEESVSFRFVNGEVVSGSSTSERGRLGETMVRHGLLSREDLDRALVVVRRDGRRLGPVLCEMGVIEPRRLEEALGLHIKDMLMTALESDDAVHVFEDQELPDLPSEDLTLRRMTGELVLEVTRRLCNAALVRQGLGDVDRVLVPVPDPPFRIDRITLTASDGYVLSRVDRATTARMIIEITPLPLEDVERSLLGLLCTGVIEYKGKPEKLTPAPSQPADEGRAQHADTPRKVAPSDESGPAKAPQEASPDAQASKPTTASEAVSAAESLVAEGRPWAAVHTLEPFLPELQGTVERRARFLLARVYLMSPESARKAEAEYLRLMQLDATDVEAPLALGKFYQERRLVARARAMFEKVLRIKPGHTAALAELASLGSTPEHSEPASFLKKLMRH
jgi:hypothetical protein